MLGIKTKSIQIFKEFAFSNFVSPKIRYKYLRRLGFNIAETTLLCQFRISGSTVDIGERVFINEWVYLDSTGGKITLEDNVHLAQRVTILTNSHRIGESPDLRCGPLSSSPTTIGKGSWIGANATILPGAHVAPGCVIAAGAVLTAPTEPNGLYAGVPARRIKNL